VRGAAGKTCRAGDGEAGYDESNETCAELVEHAAAQPGS
jgi:hypothetical protein